MIKIRKATPEDLHLIISISNDELGQGYFEDISKIIADNYSHILVADYNEKEIVGFIYFYTWATQFEGNSVQSGFKQQGAVLKTMAVSAKYQNKGYGSQLLKHAIDSIKNQEIKNITGVAWKNPKGQTNVEHPLLKLGFKKEREIENFWYKDSVEKEFDCPICGNPCLCTAEIYQLHLD